jgi:hypothetical protein
MISEFRSEDIKMKITKQRLRKIIRESLLVETEMLKIIHNPYEDLDVINRVANYALADDLKGAIADPEVNYEHLDLDLDEMGTWVKRVGDGSSQWMSEDTVIPDNWDADVVYDFMEDLLDEWHTAQGQAADQKHNDAPDVREREIIGQALGYGYVLPDDLKSITFQVRKKGGSPSNINVEDDRSIGNISLSSITGTTPDKIIAALTGGGAKGRKKQKSIRHTPPMYD